jgi:hypothetical protein
MRQMITGGTAAAGATAGTSTTEVILTFTATLFRNYVSMGTASSFAISAGKNLRITSMSAAVKANAATVASAIYFLRSQPAGTTTTSSPLVFALPVAVPAVSGQLGFASIDFGDGLDIAGNAAGTNTFGISVTPTWTTTAATIYCWITGYEY